MLQFSIKGAHSKLLLAKRGLGQGDPISQLLFVLAMEYFNRVLQSLDANPNFNYHPKCEHLKIINLCFADDILMFVRGDSESMRHIIDKVKDFSEAAGLIVSIPKSKMYFGGVDEESRKIIQITTGFAMGNLPFKYLRVPLASKKLTINDCQPLIEKMMVRLRHWSTRLLSYVGKFPLVKSVIFSIGCGSSRYLKRSSPILIVSVEVSYGLGKIPKRVNPPSHGSTRVTLYISAGGLNIIYLRDWNKATIRKLLWNVYAKKDRMWIN